MGQLHILIRKRMVTVTQNQLLPFSQIIALHLRFSAVSSHSNQIYKRSIETSKPQKKDFFTAWINTNAWAKSNQFKKQSIATPGTLFQIKSWQREICVALTTFNSVHRANQWLVCDYFLWCGFQASKQRFDYKYQFSTDSFFHYLI